jgi:hypothetical protein
MELRVTLSPDGGLRLILPTGRPLDVGCTEASLRFIQRILMNVGRKDQPGHIGEFPTQHIIEIWRRQDLAAKVSAEKERFADMGIDLAGLDISL